MGDFMKDTASFEGFVVGESNRFAYDLCAEITNYPGEKYNPVFLYGAPGNGKTHLLKSIAREIGRKHPQLRVIYVSSETFVGEYIESLRRYGASSKENPFRKKYREEVDVLLIDDIQYLAGKEATQEEFYHVFDALYRQGKQIVISASVPRAELKNIGEALVSRFGMGVTAEILEPDTETKLEILKMKQKEFGMELEAQELHQIAESDLNNVRLLEGYLKKRLLMKALNGEV